jgi:spore germination protein
MLIHVVRPGEALWQIAQYYGASVPAIIGINELPNPSRLLIGQALVIPTQDVIHTVKPGETLWQIARDYGISLQELIGANRNINPANIYLGLKIFVPAPRHVVRRGETLSQVALRYGVPLQALIEVNSITNPNAVRPGTVLFIPTRKKQAIEVNGYIDRMGEEAGAAITRDGRHLTYMSPFAYMIRENGTLEGIDDAAAIRAAYAQRVTPMMSITNFTSTSKGENLAHTVLADPANVERLLNTSIGIMRQKGYRALNVDFENVLPADRELYNQFLERAAARLHQEGFLLSTALAPKTSAEQKGALYEAHDYPSHGRIADFVVLMTYEWGYRKGPPQPISPLNEIIKVLDYAVSVIPRSKIFFGFQIYARDWLVPHEQGQEAETFSNQEAIARAVRYGAVIRYDTRSQTPFYRYTDEQGRQHEVWFEDARSAQAKFDAVKRYGLRGISYWVLGYPFPQNWVLLEDNFTIKKLI